jgi:hypothetical protein
MFEAKMLQRWLWGRRLGQSDERHRSLGSWDDKERDRQGDRGRLSEFYSIVPGTQDAQQWNISKFVGYRMLSLLGFVLAI